MGDAWAEMKPNWNGGRFRAPPYSTIWFLAVVLLSNIFVRVPTPKASQIQIKSGEVLCYMRGSSGRKCNPFSDFVAVL